MFFLRAVLGNISKTANRAVQYRLYSSNTTKYENTLEIDKPIEYSKSPANKWSARASREGTNSERLWYEPWVVLGSTAVFMLYFCVYREESDIDEEFDRTLYSRIRGLEEQQLIIALKYNKERGLETKAIEDRLNELLSRHK